MRRPGICCLLPPLNRPSSWDLVGTSLFPRAVWHALCLRRLPPCAFLLAVATPWREDAALEPVSCLAGAEQHGQRYRRQFPNQPANLAPRGRHDLERDEKDQGAADWLEAELADTLDEDYELELSEPALSLELRKLYQKAHP